MGVSALLRSFGDDEPSGENLEYDPVFTEMELAAAPGEERQMGDSVLAAEEPDWREVAQKATAVLEQSHDIRAAVYLATAELAMRGLPGFADVTGYIRGCLEDYWDTCHPQLDADDDNDPTMRVNAVLALADANTVLRGLRRAPLTESRAFGRFTLRDIQIAEGEIVAGPDEENIPDTTLVGAAFQDTGPEKLGVLREAAETAAANIKAISARFDEMTPGQGPDLDVLARLVGQIVSRLRNATGGAAKRRRRRRRPRPRMCPRPQPVPDATRPPRWRRCDQFAQRRRQRAGPDHCLLQAKRALESRAVASVACETPRKRRFPYDHQGYGPEGCRERQSDRRTGRRVNGIVTAGLKGLGGGK